MAKPLLIQRYYLGLLWYVRVFGVVFTVLAAVITASNLPWLIRKGDLGELALNVAVGIAFFLIGSGVYWVSTKVLRKYRAFIEAQVP